MDKAEQQFDARAADWITRAQKSGRPVYTFFLNPSQQSVLRTIAGSTSLCLSEQAPPSLERKVLALHEPIHARLVFPVRLLRIDFYPGTGALSHRDILGALLGTGVERTHVGDIAILDKYAHIWVMETVSGFIQQEMCRAGRHDVRVFAVEQEDWNSVAQAQGRKIRVTVASLRLDSLVSAGFRVPRGQAASQILAGAVLLNWRVQDKPAHTVREADTITWRGHGRIQLCEISNQSRKGRTWVELEVYD